MDLFIKFSEYSTFWQQIVEGLHLDLSKNATENKSKKIYDIQKNNEKNDDAKIDNTKSDNATVDNKKDYNKLDFNNREISTGNNYAYLRIADGCDNFCTFCAIPYIRGRFKSRTEEDIIKEAELLL